MASKKSSKASSQPSPSVRASAPSMTNKYMIYAGIGLAVILVGWYLYAYSGNDSYTYDTNQPAQQQNDAPYQAPPAELPKVALKATIDWPANIKDTCKSCMSAPAGCTDAQQSVAYSCTLPDSFGRTSGTWTCTRYVSGEKGGSLTRDSCSATFDHYIRVSPDQTSVGKVCCTYVYVDPTSGQQKQTEEVCATQTYTNACQ